jgi:drug/metabolite transporter (DMT)-like permease
MLPIALGLGAAACIGVADFAAGLASRRVSSLLVGFWSQVSAVIMAAVLLLILRPEMAPGQIPWGLAAGLGTGAGLALLYRAMSYGAISLVGPITACSIVFPVGFALVTGETVTPLAAAGIVSIIVGVVLASLQPAPVVGDPTDTGVTGDRRATTLAILAAVAFGAFFILIDLAPQASGWGTLWTAGAARVTSFGVQVALVLHGPRSVSWPGRLGVVIAAAGILDQMSLVLVSLGAMTDAYGIVTALVGLYPVVMILLGVVFLGERLTRIQATGAALAISGVLLVSI